MLKYLILFCVATTLAGCGKTSPDISIVDVTATVQIEVVNAKERLGHERTTSDVTPIWLDGCRVRLISSGEPFVIYWSDNEIEDTGFRFESGKKYSVTFTGRIEERAMSYEGKCIGLGQVVKVEEL